MGYQALDHLLNTFPRLSLLYQRPAAKNRTERPPVRKFLLCGEINGAFGVFLGITHLAAEGMEHGSSAQDITQAIGVRHLLRQSHRFLVPCESLVRIAKMPQRTRSKALAYHPSVLAIAK